MKLGRIDKTANMVFDISSQAKTVLEDIRASEESLAGLGVSTGRFSKSTLGVLSWSDGLMITWGYQV